MIRLSFWRTYHWTRPTMHKSTLWRTVTMDLSFIRARVMALSTFGPSNPISKVMMVVIYKNSQLFKVVRSRPRAARSQPSQLYHPPRPAMERWSFMVEPTKYCASTETRRAVRTLRCSPSRQKAMMKYSEHWNSTLRFKFMFFDWLTQGRNETERPQK